MNQRQFEILNMLVEFNTESPPGRNTDPLQNEIELLLRFRFLYSAGTPL